MRDPVATALPRVVAHVRLSDDGSEWLVQFYHNEPPIVGKARDYACSRDLDAALAAIEAAKKLDMVGFLSAREAVALELPDGTFAVFPWGHREV